MLDMFEVDEKMDLDFVVDLFGLVVRWSGQSNCEFSPTSQNWIARVRQIVLIGVVL